MTSVAEQVPRSIGVDVGLWRVVGAPTSTLVVVSARPVPDPLPVLETAVATAPVRVAKVALVRPVADAAEAAGEYVFAQVVPGENGPALDLSPECGHSMLATAAHLSRANGRDGSFQLLTNRLGRRRLVDCTVATDGDSYRCGLRFPLDDPAAAFPLGRACLPLEVSGLRLSVFVVDSGNPYVFVWAQDLGITRAAELFAAGDDLRRMLGSVRRAVAPLLGLTGSAVLPKPSVLLRQDDGTLCTRSLTTDDWHPGLALTGLVAVATWTAAIDRRASELRVLHPSGMATARLGVGRDGTMRVEVDGREVQPLAMMGR